MLQEESLFTAIHSFHISLSILIFTNLPSLNDVFDSQAFFFWGSLVADGFPSSNFFSLHFSAASFAFLSSFAYSIAS